MAEERLLGFQAQHSLVYCVSDVMCGVEANWMEVGCGIVVSLPRIEKKEKNTLKLSITVSS